MMMDCLFPKTKSELIKVLQRMRISKIEILDGYQASDSKTLETLARDMSAGSHDLTVILVRS